MKSIAAILVLILAGVALPQDDVEAKKKRLGQVMKDLYKNQVEAEKLMKELSGGDPAKGNAILQEVLEKDVPEMAAMFANDAKMSNERMASVMLKTFASAEADFRANDRDVNHVNDFWVGDLSGLYRIEVDGLAIKLIELSAALADARPVVPLEAKAAYAAAPKTKFSAAGKAVAKAGYYFAAVESYVENGNSQKYDQGGGRNTSMFGFCAVPAEYGKSGKNTFLINESNDVFSKDTAGKPVKEMPEDPVKAGWTAVR